MSLEALSLTVYVLLGSALLCAGFGLARVHPLPRPELGPRGLQRARWLAHPSGALEPALRWFAGLLRGRSNGRAHAALETLIERSGHVLGLCADECRALCVLFAGASAAVAIALGAGAAWAGVAACAGALAPIAELYERGRARQRAIGRGLPAVIDLMALCMGAGLDFSAALERVTGELGAGGATRDALGLELRRLQHEVAIGRARARVLAELAERVPTPAVREFAHAVIQAERRGNPLAPVLDIQARSLRMRRSVLAEEAAARASVLLLLPLLLLLGAVMLLLFGPFVVNGMGL